MRRRAGALVAVLAICGCSSGQASLAGSGSPPADWHVAYTGYGQVRSGNEGNDPGFVLMPARPDSATATHSALVLSTRAWRDFTLVVRLRTNSQLRKPHPNNWEVGWLLWHYTGESRFYYLILKPDGFELGKEDPAAPGQQRFLVTRGEPSFPVGRSYFIRVVQHGDAMSVSVDGRTLVRYTDSDNPYRSGHIGLYTEDAAATYQIISLTQAP